VPFFAGKEIKDVRQIIIRSGQPSVVEQVAERVYGIRCRIVHSKDGGGDRADADPLLPFSREAKILNHDIDLVRHLAVRAIMAKGSSAHW
jgi:hypothetical protein